MTPYSSTPPRSSVPTTVRLAGWLRQDRPHSGVPALAGNTVWNGKHQPASWSHPTARDLAPLGCGSVRRGSPTPPKRLTGGLPSALLRTMPSLLGNDAPLLSATALVGPYHGTVGRLAAAGQAAFWCAGARRQHGVEWKASTGELVTPNGARPRPARVWLAVHSLRVRPSGSVLCCWSIAVFFLPTICPREQAGTNGAPVGTR
jgi:hypothetical protein